MKHIIAIATILLLAGCSHKKHHGDHHDHGSKEHVCTCGKDKDGSIKAKVVAKSGSKVTGMIKAKQLKGGVELSYNLENLTANGMHGFHIHDIADCSAKDASSAGGHWNPEGHKHGGPGGKAHAGDLGNLKADASGKAQGSILVKGRNLAEIKDKSLVVHAKADDLKSDPAGNSGDRIGCGVF